jgi:spermidine/putrescine transport system permease protein
MSALAHVSSAGGTTPPPAPQPNRKGRSWVPYLLLLPGALWLLVFFVIPLVPAVHGQPAVAVPGLPRLLLPRPVNFGNYVTALTDFAPHFGRSILFAGLATFFAFCLAYPLAYAMAFKAGRWRNVMMIAVIAPFFTSFILRTVAWRQILADEGPVASTLNTLHLLPGGRITETWIAVVAGLTYNFLPFMVLPIYASLERADPGSSRPGETCTPTGSRPSAR